jgi:integrase
MLSARDLCDAIRPYLPVVESTLFMVGESASGANPPMPSQLRTSDKAFGSEGRVERAASRLFHLRAQVRAAINAELQTNPERRLSAERVRALADRVTQLNNADEVLGRAARAVLLDALARLSRRGWTVDGLPTLRRSLEPPAFPPGSPRARAFVAGVRTRFIELLGHWRGSRPAWRPAWRTAEILLSATLFGARTDPRALGNLLSAIREGQIFRRGAALIVEPGPAPGATDQRIIVDPMTAALIVGACPRHVHNAPTSAPALVRTDYDDEVERCLRALLRRLGTAPPERTPVLDWWCDIAKAYWRVELAGSEWAAAEGILRPQSVATTALVRALDGRRCGPLDGCNVPEAPTPRVSPDIGQPSPTLTDALAWAECLRASIHAAATLHAGTRGADERTRRTELAHRLAALGRTTVCARAQTSTPDRLVTMLAEWILDRARHGGLRTDEHHTTSLYSYYTRIATPLIELSWTLDLCALDRDQLETLFAAVMDRAPRRSQRGWLNALKSLHGSWMRLYGLPAVDWHSVAAETAMRDGADRLPVVNWLTFAEYRCALRLLESDSMHDLRLSRHTRFLLLVLFHFGLRPGEAGRLTFGQVEFDGDRLTLFIRPTTFGSLKTDASRRNVPQLQRFAADELELVRAVLRSADAEDDEDALLLSAPGAPQQRYNARLVEARVVDALRAATGDPTVTLYACRHAFATRVALALVVAPPLSNLAGEIAIALSGSEEAVAHCRALLLDGQDHSPYRWDILAELLGHADLTTAISVYANAAEFVLDLRVARVEPPVMSARMLAYVFGVSVSSINQRRRRSGRDTLCLPGLLGDYGARLPSLDRVVRNCAGPPLLKPLDDAVQPLSVLDVDAILCGAAVSSAVSVRTDSIVEFTLHSVERVEAVLRSATEFALETGMLDWGAYQLDGMALLSSPSRPAVPEVRRRALHRRAWLASALRDDVDTVPLVRAVTVWAARFHPVVPLFVVRAFSELDDIVATLQLLNISEQRLRIVWPAGVKRSPGLARLLAARFPSADIDGRRLQRISRARHWRAGEVGLQVGAVAGDTAPGGRDFFRALALIWIHTRALHHLIGNAHEQVPNQ